MARITRIKPGRGCSYKDRTEHRDGGAEIGHEGQKGETAAYRPFTRPPQWAQEVNQLLDVQTLAKVYPSIARVRPFVAAWPGATAWNRPCATLGGHAKQQEEWCNR